MKYFTISWDDGFKKSTVKTAEIYEKYGLKAEFNIVSKWCLDAGGSSNFCDFALLKELEARGHAIQPHSYDHSNLVQIPLNEAIENIQRGMDIMSVKLARFDPGHTIFNFPYNASNAEIENYLIGRKLAFRTGHSPVINPLPGPSTLKITTGGWEQAEEWLETCVEDLMNRESGWLVYNAHGLDGEGWGPIRSYFLEKTLDKVSARQDIKILTSIEVLDLFKNKNK